MNSSLNLSQIESLQQRLLKHAVYDAVNDRSSLQIFMHHHVYGVWDFMSLLKYLQHVIAPATWPWQPSASVSLRHFVNEIVLGEESDEGLPARDGQKSMSATSTFIARPCVKCRLTRPPALEFISVVKRSGLETAFASGIPPQPCVEFMRISFGFIATGKAHVVRLHLRSVGAIIPLMFRALLQTHEDHRATGASVLLLPAASHPNG